VIFCGIMLGGFLVGSGCVQDTGIKQINGNHWVGIWASSAQEVESKLMPSDFQELDDAVIDGKGSTEGENRRWPRRLET
jgi:hypothetical protein